MRQQGGSLGVARSHNGEGEEGRKGKGTMKVHSGGC